MAVMPLQPVHSGHGTVFRQPLLVQRLWGRGALCSEGESDSCRFFRKLSAGALAAGMVAGLYKARASTHSSRRRLGLFRARATPAGASSSLPARQDEGDATLKSSPEQVSRADLMRQELWEMPSSMEKYQKKEAVRYKDKDKRYVHRELVVLKGKGSQKMIEKSQRLLANSTILDKKARYMESQQKPNFGPQQSPFWEMNKDGLRAWRMRSGMRDQRYETEFKRPMERVIDNKRKRKTFAQVFGRRKRIRRQPGRKSNYSNRHRK
mmetsp:Transcript_30099/g.70180  ORF Transcript_30099/g.70180 Transcript_30099/m.70180 type:complete len:265 (+) Transcript_30099:69-863(+)